jgi:hypothetical protein
MVRRFPGLSVSPAAWAATGVSHGHNEPSVLGCLTIDDLKWIPLEQKEPVTIVAQGITLRACGNRFQRLLKLGFKPFGNPSASFGVPSQGIRVLLLSSLGH